MSSSMVQPHNAAQPSPSKLNSHPIYEPLEDGNIRLLVLAPGTHDEPLRGLLIPVSRVETATECTFEEKYVALSYTWGDQSDPIKLELNGSYTLQIGRNLASALVHARMKDNPCALWVDALCIDQKDDVEKGSQVQEMPTIYEAASLTLIWLGDEFDGVGEAFQWLRGLWTRTMDETDSFDKLNDLLSPAVALTLKKILGLPWWRRAWIIQEATVSKEALVMCGTHSVLFDYFVTLANILNSFIHTGRISRPDCRYSLLMPAGKDLLTLAEIRCSWRRCDGSVNFMDLEALLRRTYLRTLATDPRDRFYALLSMTTNENWRALRPDYTITRDTLFLKATLHLIRNKSSLDILQLGENLMLSGNDPSWLPSWDAPSDGLESREPIKGYWHSAEGVSFNISTSTGDRVLILSGKEIGELSHVSAFQSEEEDRFPPPICILSWLASLQTPDGVPPTPDPYANTCGKQEAFVRSLVAGYSALVSETDTYGELPLRNVFLQWCEMTSPDSNIPLAWRRLQESTPHREFNVHNTPVAVFRRHALQALRRRCFVVLTNGYMGIAPDEAREQDVVALLRGCSTPVCLRREQGHFKWIGAMYVHGLMYGELGAENGGLLTDFEIH